MADDENSKYAISISSSGIFIQEVHKKHEEEGGVKDEPEFFIEEGSGNIGMKGPRRAGSFRTSRAVARWRRLRWRFAHPSTLAFRSICWGSDGGRRGPPASRETSGRARACQSPNARKWLRFQLLGRLAALTIRARRANRKAEPPRFATATWIYRFAGGADV